jgi:hypothetical protein
MSWSVLLLNRSPSELLSKTDGKPFSKSQILIALLAWFAEQSPDFQDQAVLDYLESQGQSVCSETRG